MIDARAVIDPAARLDADVTVGPYAVIGADVEIGAGTTVGAHVLIQGPTRIGRDNTIHAFAALGGDPQDKKYRHEPTTLEIGDGNTLREYVTINRGTAQDLGATRIGDDNWIMAYAHIAHDCVIGSHTVFANAASLAGHVQVGDYATLGGFTLVSQFCRIGEQVFSAMGSVINRDVPPYVTVSGHMAEPYGINVEGLKRRGYARADIESLWQAYKLLYRSSLRLEEALVKLDELAVTCVHVGPLIDFLRQSTRGIIR